ncbi:MAG: HlyD family efflux transporter periplasmic adaptor subunit [Treponema sp.]|nr:HlyD family efflux transporter periplasmic adaptor subunit [Treponema sp.]
MKHNLANKKKIIPVFLLLIIAGGFFGFRLIRGNDLVLRGEVEGTVYSQISEVPGRIIEMNIELGSPVKAGDLIARLDSTDLRYMLEQLQINLERIRLMSEEGLIIARNNVSSAEAGFRSAEASYVQARDDIEPLERMWEAGGIARNELDRARLRLTIAAQTMETARSQLQTARSHLSLMQSGADSRTIALAEADIREIESRIRQTWETLEKYEIRASRDGIVISINYNLGSMVNTGYNIADISADNQKYVVCYVPEEKSGQITYGQHIAIKSGREEIQGEVRYIDVRSRYTPKDMQTSATKNKVSVKVRILLPADSALIPGSKVEVIIR